MTIDEDDPGGEDDVWDNWDIDDNEDEYGEDETDHW